MKNKGLIIILIILLAMIVISLIVFLVLCLNGTFNIMELTNFNLKKSSNVILEEEYEEKIVNNIEVLSNAGDITLQESTSENIRVVVYGKNRSNLKVNLEDNRLKIENLEHRVSFLGFNSYINDIIIYVPTTYSKEINISNDYGNCQITDLEKATVNAEIDCGDIKLGKIKDATIKSKYGNVTIGTIQNKFDIESDCGDIKIEKLDIKEDSNIKSDLR